ncbi:MAG: hypothetical protein M1828_002245 [Chrysothrix sp. TS-e1954]|nr:MAG: hypothetical protein M1828_002245 [Chrysothrix sp. TS-e1954]
MFPTFTGSARRPRQMNLSGRTANPFAQFGAPQNTVENAQKGRMARQEERERIKAAVFWQSRWRGYFERQKFREIQRHRWIEIERKLDEEGLRVYRSEDEASSHMHLLTGFVQLDREDDVQRLKRTFMRQVETERSSKTEFTGGDWRMTYLRLQRICLDALERSKSTESAEDRSYLFTILRYLGHRRSNWSQKEFNRYYSVMATRLKNNQAPLDVIIEPLRKISTSTVAAYRGFAKKVLTLPDLRSILGGQQQLDDLASEINCKLLANAISNLLRIKPTPPSPPSTVNPKHIKAKSLTSNTLKNVPSRTWLLAHLIYIYRHAHQFVDANASSSNEDFIAAVGSLLASVVDHIEVDIDVSDTAISPGSPKSDIKRGSKLLHPFVREQLHSLVNQESVSGLLSQMSTKSGVIATRSPTETAADDHGRALANYVLTLLRLFPSRGEDIRMWLYLGSNSSPNRDQRGQADVISFFWKAASTTPIFNIIYHDPKAAIRLLKHVPKKSKDESLATSPAAPNSTFTSIDDQWRTMVIFIELYVFVLRVMDDDEFFGDAPSLNGSMTTSVKGRKNSLQLVEIEHLVTFLKNLGFTMYYHAADILAASDEEKQKDIASFFKLSKDESAEEEPRKPQSTHIAGLEGVSLDYVKGLVTGLLRSIYERDSRRPFLPKNHWLMTARFDMGQFIGGVVEEEERRHQVQDAEDHDDPESDSDESDTLSPRSTLTGMRHAQGVLRTSQMERQRRKASRRRYLQAVAPRLEILQNMPFLIPFTTRVQIFRRFVHLDQLKRRNGTVDPELWRMRMMHGPDLTDARPLERHHASIRRQHEFEDAYDQFYQLGQSLKEPINITFVDRFGSAEAGIDGGGVTKEFLTSVTNEVFSKDEGLRMFSETDKHLLYPNPAVVEEQKEIIRDTGLSMNAPEAREQVVDLLQRYEFLGRIIGKCLYEGILIDIQFASFFLLKWALTGGTGSAPKESGYRAGLNDLRDFDESLYQGLLQLKNYPGNVEDFSLNFTVTDTIALPTTPPSSKTVTRDLRPGGSFEPVTNANRLAYISYIARHRLSNQPFRQTQAFLSGLSSLIQPSWLSMFNQTELQTLLGGAPTPLDVNDLRRNTYYGGLYVIGDDGEEHPAVQLFWNVMHKLDDEDRRKVIKFVTSTPRAPLLGFGTLNPRFSIRDSGTDETRLPSTSTCVNLLKLPRYTNGERLKHKLLQAVNSGAGFDLS